MRPFPPILSLFIALAACEARIGKGGEEAAATGGGAAGPAPATAEGKAEAGQFSIKAPGIDLKLDIPSGVADKAEIDSDSEILYPGSSLSGMHIEAGDQAGGRDNNEVELRFVSGDAPAKIVAWYRDPARAADFSVTSARPEGDGFAIVGKQADGRDGFTVKLSPRGGGGTEGRMILSQGG